MKAEDRFCIPLCRTHHRQLHNHGNEIEYLKRHEIYDPVNYALQFYDHFLIKDYDGAYDRIMQRFL